MNQMMKKLYGYFLLLMLLTIKSGTAQSVEKLRIDPSMAYGGKVSEYFEQVNYIPLETTKESLFGDVNQLIVTDSSYIVYDSDTRAVLFFTLQGKYITKAKFLQNEYPNMLYEKSDNRIVIIVYRQAQKKSIKNYYTLTGKLIGNVERDESLAKSGMVSLGNGYNASTDICFFPKGVKPVDTVTYLLKIYKGDSLCKSFFPYNQKENMAACALNGWLTVSKDPFDEGVLYACPPMDGGIYRITKDTAIKLYQMVFPLSRAIPKNIAESKDLKFLDSLRDNGAWATESTITGVSNIFFNKQLLFFKTDAVRYSWSFSSEDSKQYNFIYDIKSGRLVSMERMSPDEQNGFLPFTSRNIKVRGLQYAEGHYYTHVSSLQLFNAKDANAGRNPKYPAEMQQYFEKESRKSNPVLVQLKLKVQE